MYAFWSGSLRYQFAPFVDRQNPIISDVTYAFSNSIQPSSAKEVPDGDWIFNFGTTYSNYINGSYPRVTNNLAQDSAILAEIPFYSEMNQCLTIYNGALLSQLPLSGKNLDPWYTGVVQFRCSAPDFGNSKIQVGEAEVLPVRVNFSAGDDFKLRYLIAPPVSLCRNPNFVPTF